MIQFQCLIIMSLWIKYCIFFYGFKDIVWKPFKNLDKRIKTKSATI